MNRNAAIILTLVSEFISVELAAKHTHKHTQVSVMAIFTDIPGLPVLPHVKWINIHMQIPSAGAFFYDWIPFLASMRVRRHLVLYCVVHELEPGGGAQSTSLI
jgi:hypothetical protein